MEFEDILKHAGDFGIFQKILLIGFLVPTSTFVPWINLSAIFISHTPEHWCYVPEVSSSNLTIEQKKYLMRPPSDPYCSRYDVNFSSLLYTENYTVDPNSSSKKCDKGWYYDTKDFDQTAVTEWNLVCENDYYKSMVVSFVFVGVIIGTPFYGFLSDRCGRKPTFIGLALLLALAETGSAVCTNFTLFLILRVVIGSTVYIYSLGYIIALELVRSDLKTRINGIAVNCWTLGLCLLPLAAYLTRSWIKLTVVIATIAASFVLYWFILPESPSWLILQERYEDAAKIIAQISRWNHKKISFEQILENVQFLGKQMKEKNLEKISPMDFLIYPNLRSRFFLCVVVWIGSSISYYGLQDNVDNLSGNEFLNFFFLSLVEIPAHFTIWWLLGNVGRKKSIQIGFIVCAVSCLGPVFSSSESTQFNILSTLIAKAGSSAVFMAQYQHTPELFPTSHRGIGMGLTSTVGIGSSLLAPFIVRLDKYGHFTPYLIFSMISGISCFCVGFLPETLNKNLPQTVHDIENYVLHTNCFRRGLNMREEYELNEKTSSNPQSGETASTASNNVFIISYDSTMN